jgi:alcohol dehydrogenase class IV
MRETLEIPAKLAGNAGIQSTDLAAELAPKAMAEEGYIPYNPKPVTEDEVRAVYVAAIEGNLE